MQFYLLIIILISAFLITIFKKSPWFEAAQIGAPILIAKMISCDFCLSFWTGLAVSMLLSPLILVGFSFESVIWVILLPAAAAPITKLLIKN